MENVKILNNGRSFSPEEGGFIQKQRSYGTLNLSKEVEVTFYETKDKNQTAILIREIDGSLYDLLLLDTNQVEKRKADETAVMKESIAKFRQGKK